MRKNKLPAAVSEPASKAIIELQGVSLGYGDKVILSPFDLSIERGSFVSIAGKSGIGKSTLLYALGGFLKPLQGTYYFEERPVYGLGEIGLGRFRKKNIGYLFQDFRLLPFLTIEQNIRFPLFFDGEPYHRERVAELMDSLGIIHRRAAYPRDISGGEAQRTALARALVMDPQVLLLDEPTGNLDEETEADILKTLLGLQKEKGLTMVCITHSHRILTKSDSVLKMSGGKIEKSEIKKKRAPQKAQKRTGNKNNRNTGQIENKKSKSTVKRKTPQKTSAQKIKTKAKGK